MIKIFAKIVKTEGELSISKAQKKPAEEICRLTNTYWLKSI